ncbi:MAG TPA: Nif3-like dinuclear metal center hexameric protein [Desulfarculaceae bacterium]|nr:Nif3-like dinuclear metal center hexameric protein [Desulfarculaceae bacterium]
MKTAVTSTSDQLCHADLIKFLEATIPGWLSESWDNCGLQAGFGKNQLTGILCSLDITAEVIDEAESLGANFILSHHPLLFKPLSHLDLEVFPGDLLGRALAGGITLYSAHTNLDSVAGGVNDHLAEILGIDQCVPLVPYSGRSCKLVTFVPAAEVDQVAAAMFAVGAGKLGAGRYSECSFQTPGTGSFRPEVGAAPRVGEIGRLNLVDEVRLETVVDEKLVTRVLEALRQAHPYEVPAYDLYSVHFSESGCGAGRIGVIENPINIDEFALLVKTRLQADAVRLIGGNLKSKVEKIALCGGSGFSLYESAQAAGADIFITGDLKYHDARSVLEKGQIPVLDAGHFATERHVVKVCAAWCRDFVAKNNADLKVAIARSESEPWITV